MTTDTNAVLRAHVQAVIKLLLGSRKLEAGLAITAGDPLDVQGVIHLARTAIAARTDAVHLEFSAADDGKYDLTGITLVAPRDGACFVQTGCSLWLSKAGTRAVILPRPERRGHYRLSPRELLHIDGKPAGNMAEGARRAKTWLERHLRDGDVVCSNVDIHNVADAA